VLRRKIQAFLRDWLRVDLSTSTINQCLHEAGRAVEPVVETQLIPELTASDLLHIDTLKGQAFGEALLLALILLMRNIHRCRETPEAADAQRAQNQNVLNLLRTLCETHQTVAHEDSRKLAVEFLNDWDAIVRVVETPSHPLTNNLAECSLRHWVLLRKTTFGSRTPQGRRVIALLASVIDTARLRQRSPWEFIAQTLTARRKDQPPPRLAKPVVA